MTTHHRHPVIAAAAVGLALGVLLAQRQRRPPTSCPPAQLHLVDRGVVERGVFDDLHSYRPPGHALGAGARPIPRGR